MSDVISDLDRAHATMMASPDAEAPRMAFYARLAATELWFLLSQDADDGDAGTTAMPEVFDLHDGRFILAFDSVERLVDFSGTAVPYAAMPGRVAVAGLLGKGVGLGLNLSVAPSSMLIPAEAVDWLAEALEQAPTQAEGRPTQYLPPFMDRPLQTLALESALPSANGLAAEAWLAGVSYGDGRLAQILVFVGVDPRAETALAKMVAEAVAFSGVDEGPLDVAVLPAGHRALSELAKVGRRFDLTPKTVPPEPARKSAPPGSDPSRPPILR
ncbi:MAG: SseB family protein [Paracoccaceae bacterium]